MAQEGKTMFEQSTEKLLNAAKKPKKEKRQKELYEDCEFYRVPRGNGKKGFRTVSVYRGTFYQADQTPKEKLLYRLGFSGIYLLLTGLFLSFCTHSAGFHQTWYVGISEGLTLVSFCYVLVTWLIYLTAEREMRAYLYRLTSKRLIRACEMAVIACGACTFALLVYLLASGFSNVPEVLSAAVRTILCGAGMYGLSKLEKAVPYRTWQSTEQPPENGEKLEYGEKA